MVMLSIYLCACLFMWRLMHIIPIGVRVKAAFVKPTVSFSSTWLNIFLMLSKLCDYVTVTETAHLTCHTMKIVTKRIAYISVIFISAVEIVDKQRSSN